MGSCAPGGKGARCSLEGTSAPADVLLAADMGAFPAFGGQDFAMAGVGVSPSVALCAVRAYVEPPRRRRSLRRGLQRLEATTAAGVAVIVQILHSCVAAHEYRRAGAFARCCRRPPSAFSGLWAGLPLCRPVIQVWLRWARRSARSFERPVRPAGRLPSLPMSNHTDLFEIGRLGSHYGRHFWCVCALVSNCDLGGHLIALRPRAGSQHVLSSGGFTEGPAGRPSRCRIAKMPVGWQTSCVLLRHWSPRSRAQWSVIASSCGRITAQSVGVRSSPPTSG